MNSFLLTAWIPYNVIRCYKVRSWLLLFQLADFCWSDLSSEFDEWILARNELLRAMDLRLTALREDFTASFIQAAGATCSTKQIADLLKFCEHFGVMELRYLPTVKCLILGVTVKCPIPSKNDERFFCFLGFYCTKILGYYKYLFFWARNTKIKICRCCY